MILTRISIKLKKNKLPEYISYEPLFFQGLHVAVKVVFCLSEVNKKAGNKLLKFSFNLKR